ncbi:MAG: hypothetical protein R3183_13155 [Oleiphilaceae bacterium]|nr:hypothetical protein [Oleiphilaceae bacterium]
MHLDTSSQPPNSLIKLVYLIYALHLFSAVNGLLSPALIVTAFLSGWPSIIALIMSYIWRDESVGTYLASHFDWLIRTFWVALVWLIIGWVLIATVIGMVIGIPMLLIVGVWVLYRLLKGLFALNDRKQII